jgi:hypothetical protein
MNLVAVILKTIKPSSVRWLETSLVDFIVVRVLASRESRYG